MNIAVTNITKRPGEVAWTHTRCFINVRSAIGTSVGLELVSDRKKCSETYITDASCEHKQIMCELLLESCKI